MMFLTHLTPHTFIGAGQHLGLVPPSVVPATLPHVSVGTLLGLTLGVKYSKTTVGPYGFYFIGKGTSTKVIPHVSIPPANALIPVTIAFGKSAPIFSASKVKMDVDGEGTPMSACLFPVVPISLNQACNVPCSFPGDIVQAPNTVAVGLTLADIVCGLLMAAMDSAMSALFNWLGNKASGYLYDKIGERVLAGLAQRYAQELAAELDQLGVDLAEQEMKEMEEDIVKNVLERPLGTLVEKSLHGVLDKVMDLPYDWLKEKEVEPHLEHALEGGEEGGEDGTPATMDGLTGANGSNPQIHNAE